MSHPASNTVDCFRYLIGRRIVGVLVGKLPWQAPDIARGTRTLVLSNGEGFTISSTGAFWIETEEDVRCAIESAQKELHRNAEDIKEVIALAGALSGSGSPQEEAKP